MASSDTVDAVAPKASPAPATAAPAAGGPGVQGKRPRRTASDSPFSAPHLFFAGIGGTVLCFVIVDRATFGQEMRVAIVSCIMGMSAAVIMSGVLGKMQLGTKRINASGAFAVFLVVFLAFMSVGAPGKLPDVSVFFRGFGKAFWNLVAGMVKQAWSTTETQWG